MRCILLGVGLLGSTAYAQAPGDVPIAPLQAPAQAQHQPDESMPLDPGVMGGQVAIGGLLGLAGAVTGGYLGYGAICRNDCDDEGDDAVFPILGGAVIGGSLMMALGIKLVGDDDKTEGSYLGAVGGSMLGGLVGSVVAVKILENTDSGDDGRAAGAFAVLGVSWLAGGMAGYYATRSWKVPATLHLAPIVAPQTHGGMTFGIGGSF
jgi:hypothetical protein